MQLLYRQQLATGLLNARNFTAVRPARIAPAQTARRPALRVHTWVMAAAAAVDLLALVLLCGAASRAGISCLPGVAGHGRGLFVALGMTVGIACVFKYSFYNAKRFMNWLAACGAALWPFGLAMAAIAAALFDLGAPAGSIVRFLTPVLLAGTVYIVASRTAWRMLLQRGNRAGQLCYRLVVIGTEASSVSYKLQQLGSPFIQIDSLPHHESSLRMANSRARRQCLDAIILAYHPTEAKLLNTSFDALKKSVPDILVYSSIAQCSGFPKTHPLSDYPVSPIQRAALRERDIFAKGLVDRLGSFVLIVALMPLLLLTALAIRLDSAGPVLFRQPRIGYNNRIFLMYKFRSMHHGSRDARARTQTSRNDKRVTRVGRLIRKCSIDELPQLLNVLRGDMSLVGPRPHAPGTNVDGVLLTQASEEYVLRHRVQPGITGWAQVNGSRGVLVKPEDILRRVALDLYYIENWSLVLDFKILALTLLRAAKTSEAF